MLSFATRRILLSSHPIGVGCKMSSDMKRDAFTTEAEVPKHEFKNPYTNEIIMAALARRYVTLSLQ